MRGQVLNEEGEPEDRFSVMVWGDYTPQQTLATGEIAELAPGHWAVSLEGQVNRRLWVQVVAGDRYLSAPVEIVFEEANAERGAAEVIFRQVRPLNWPRPESNEGRACIPRQSLLPLAGATSAP